MQKDRGGGAANQPVAPGMQWFSIRRRASNRNFLKLKDNCWWGGVVGAYFLGVGPGHRIASARHCMRLCPKVWHFDSIKTIRKKNPALLQLRLPAPNCRCVSSNTQTAYARSWSPWARPTAPSPHPVRRTPRTRTTSPPPFVQRLGPDYGPTPRSWSP